MNPPENLPREDVKILRAKAAYAAYGETVDWKNFRGDMMPQWNQLPEKIQKAWLAAADYSLLHWLETTFRDSVKDEPKLEFLKHLMKVGQDQGDEPNKILQIVLLSFVSDLIDPEMFQRPPV